MLPQRGPGAPWRSSAAQEQPSKPSFFQVSQLSQFMVIHRCTQERKQKPVAVWEAFKKP